MNYVDLHSHPLPAVDDGPGSFSESIELIEAAWRAGTRRMVATPHMFQASLGSSDPAEISRLFAEFQTRLAAHRAETSGPYLEGFELALGAENYVGADFLEALTSGAVLTLAGSRFLLIEFWPMITAVTAGQAIDAVQERGLVPVLAHVERYGFLQSEPQRLNDLVAAGSVAQVNAAAILGHQGLRPAQLADRWLARGLIAVVASDGHDTGNRRPQLDAVAERLRSRYGEVTEDLCLRLNPAAILADETIRLPPARRARWWRRES